MKKANIIHQLFGMIILIGLAGISMVWFAEAIGTLGGIFLFCAAVGSYYFYSRLQSKKSQMEFEILVRHVLYNRLDWREAKKMNRQLSLSCSVTAEIIRNLQILRESIDIALSSKKRETAESRMASVSEILQRIETRTPNEIPPELFNEIKSVVLEANEKFQTDLFLNLASAHVAKAEKLKTKKSKEKYLDLAKDILVEGLEKGEGKGGKFNTALSAIEQARATLT